jgi:hypothetical protein
MVKPLPQGLLRFGVALFLLSLFTIPPAEAQRSRSSADSVRVERTDRNRAPARAERPARERTPTEQARPAEQSRPSPATRPAQERPARERQQAEPARTNNPDRSTPATRPAQERPTPDRSQARPAERQGESGQVRPETRRGDTGRDRATTPQVQPDRRGETNVRTPDRTRDRQPATQQPQVNRPRGERGANPRPNPPHYLPAPPASRPVIIVPRVYTPPRIYVQPRMIVGVDIWPWETRMRRGWTPRYQYRQVVHADAGWGSRHHANRLEIVTVYRHRVRQATRSRAEMEVRIEEIQLYENGYFLGRVNRIPGELSRVRAMLYRNGRVEFDMTPYILGDADHGFEMLLTPYSERHLLEGYVPDQGMRVADLDLRSGRALRTRFSRLYDPRDFRGIVPVQLLPEDGSWLFDYAYDVAGYAPHVRGYYGHRHPGLRVDAGVHMYRLHDNYQFRTQTGWSISLSRELELLRLDH